MAEEAPPPYSPAYPPRQDMEALYEYSPGPKGYMPVPQQLPPPAQPPPYDYSPAQPVPQQLPPPAQPPAYDYSPAQPVPSQQSNSNVAVVNQPSSPPSTVHVVQTRANEHMTLTLVMLLLSILHGNLPALVFLIPAVYFSCLASGYNDSGEYEEAKKFGNAVLCCNGCVFIYYVLLILIGVVVLTVHFTVIVGHTADTASTGTIRTNCYDSYRYCNSITFG